MADMRIVELLEFAACEGLTLPLSPEEIVAVEEAGGCVDLETGQVLHGAARWLVEPTVVGEAVAVVLATEAGHAPA